MFSRKNPMPFALNIERSRWDVFIERGQCGFSFWGLRRHLATVKGRSLWSTHGPYSALCSLRPSVKLQNYPCLISPQFCVEFRLSRVTAPGINFSSNRPSLVWKNGRRRSLHNPVIHIFLVPICVQTSPPCSVLCSKKWVWTIARILNLVRIWIENSRLTIFAFTLWFELFDAIYSFINFYVATHFPVISLKPFSCSIISSAPYSFNDFWGLYLIWTQMCQRKCLAFGDIGWYWEDFSQQICEFSKISTKNVYCRLRDIETARFTWYND